MALLPTSIHDSLSSLPGGGNKTNTSICPLGPDNWTYTFVPLYVLPISVLGIALNIFVLMVFILHKAPCTVAEIYLSNLAAADLVLVSFLPFWAVSSWNKLEWIFGLALCKMVNVAILMNVYCSIYFVVLVSIDRYLALVYPLSSNRMRRPKFAQICCVLVWILGFLLSIPQLLNKNLVHNGNMTKCEELDKTIKITNKTMISAFGFVIPISFIFFCTAKILKTLSSRFMEGVNVNKTDRKATTLILAVLLAFLICWVPFHLLKIPTLLHEAHILKGCSGKMLHFCGHIFTYLAIFNSVLNPFLYVIVGKNFREKFKELCKQRGHKQSLTFSITFTGPKPSGRVESQLTLT